MTAEFFAKTNDQTQTMQHIFEATMEQTSTREEKCIMNQWLKCLLDVR